MKKREIKEYIDSNLNIKDSNVPDRSDMETGKKYSDERISKGSHDPKHFGIAETKKEEVNPEPEVKEVPKVPRRDVDKDEIAKMVEEIISNFTSEDKILPKHTPKRGKVRLDRQTTLYELKGMAAEYRMEVFTKLMKYLGVDKLSNYEKSGLINYIKGDFKG